MLSLMTPTELLQTFPVTKRYDGAKYQCKDYFSVIESLKGLDMEKPFKEQGIDMMKILYDYQNRWIDNIVIYSMLLVDKIRVAEGKDDMFTAFCKSQGMKPPRTIKVYEDAKGKKYMVDENGKSMPLHKAKPKWLKVVK